MSPFILDAFGRKAGGTGDADYPYLFKNHTSGQYDGKPLDFRQQTDSAWLGELLPWRLRRGCSHAERHALSRPQHERHRPPHQDRRAPDQVHRQGRIPAGRRGDRLP